MDASNYVHVQGQRDPYIAFKKLEAVHHGTTSIGLESLINKFHTYSLGPNGTVEEAASALRNLQTEISLIDAEEKITEQTLKQRLLSSLPPAMYIAVIII